MQQNLLVEDNSNDRMYFTIVPNFILNHSSATDQAVYLQMKRLTDDSKKNVCYPSFRYLTKQLKIGVGSLRKSIKYLVNHKWIEDVGKKRVRTKGGWQWVQAYKINDIWNLNMQYYKGVSNQTPPNDTKVYPERIQGVSSSLGIRRTIDKKEQTGLYYLYGNEKCRVVPNIKKQGAYRILVKGEWQDYGGRAKDLIRE